MIAAGAAVCALYPPSRSLEDLVEPFQGKVNAFLVELHLRRCTVHVSATRRPLERAYLMHYAWLVSRRECAPSAVPTTLPDGRPAPEIQWTVAGAAAMVAAYELVHEPSLTSRHLEGRAIDLTVTYPEGAFDSIADLYALGERYGVHHLRGDPVHWSDDGR